MHYLTEISMVAPSRPHFDAPNINSFTRLNREPRQFAPTGSHGTVTYNNASLSLKNVRRIQYIYLNWYLFFEPTTRAQMIYSIKCGNYFISTRSRY